MKQMELSVGVGKCIVHNVAEWEGSTGKEL